MVEHQYGLLTQAEEDALHKTRLLAIDERPFKRITKRLLPRDSPLMRLSRNYERLPSDAQSTDEATAALLASRAQDAEARKRFRQEVQFDFDAFESSIKRMQFTYASNAKERERYLAQKAKIVSEMQAVRENNVELKQQLVEAQSTLATRKTWDELADKITRDKQLKPRDEQHANLEKLRQEIAELEEETRDYKATWAERREQFGKIVEEGLNLRRLIRDEKEEVERREGMVEDDEGEDGDGVSRGKLSAMGTPHGGATPLHVQDEGSSTAGSLMVHKRKGARSSSRGNSPAPSTASRQEKDDVAMADEGEIEDEARAATEADVNDAVMQESEGKEKADPAEGLVAEEDGSSKPSASGGDQMDTS